MSRHRVKMTVTLRYILPEELDMASGDAAATAQNVYACQQHIDMLHQLKLEDLRSQVGRPFRETYTDFRSSVNLAELLDQIIGVYHAYYHRQLLQRGETFLRALVSELETRYEKEFQGKGLTRSGGVRKIANGLCRAMGLRAHSPPMTLTKRNASPVRQPTNPTPTPPEPQIAIGDSTQDTEEEVECEVRIRAKRRRSAPPATHDQSSPNPSGSEQLSTIPVPSITTSAVTADALQQSIVPEEVLATEQLASYLESHFLKPWRDNRKPIDLNQLQVLMTTFCTHIGKITSERTKPP